MNSFAISLISLSVLAGCSASEATGSGDDDIVVYDDAEAGQLAVGTYAVRDPRGMDPRIPLVVSLHTDGSFRGVWDEGGVRASRRGTYQVSRTEQDVKIAELRKGEVIVRFETSSYLGGRAETKGPSTMLIVSTEGPLQFLVARSQDGAREVTRRTNENNLFCFEADDCETQGLTIPLGGASCGYSFSCKVIEADASKNVCVYQSYAPCSDF